MKVILWQGQRIETNDRIADAVFELARLLLTFRRAERIDFPAHAHGTTITVSIIVSEGVPVGMHTLPEQPDRQLESAAEVVETLERRIERLDEQPMAGDFRLPDDFSVLDHDIAT